MQKSGITINGIYKHYKGDYYKVIEVAYHNETLKEPLVIYHKCDENGLYKRITTDQIEFVPQPFYRPLYEFKEKTNLGLNVVERFKLIK